MAGIVLLTGCRSGGEAAAPEATPARGDAGLSFYEQRLLELIERQQALEAYAAEAGPADRPEIERRFRDLAGVFQSIIADNPEEIEVRLIYGKFLDFFGDEDGARAQFEEVLRRDAGVPVAYQQLGTYYAEQGDFGRALAYYLTATERAPEEAVYHFAVGELLSAYREEFLSEAGLTRETLDSQMLNAYRRAAELEPENFVYPFRYGEAFYALAEPDWEAALAHWEAMQGRDDLSTRQAGAIRLHRAQVLGELGRYAEARALALRVEEPALRALRAALLEAIEEAEGREAAG